MDFEVTDIMDSAVHIARDISLEDLLSLCGGVEFERLVLSSVASLLQKLKTHCRGIDWH